MAPTPAGSIHPGFLNAECVGADRPGQYHGSEHADDEFGERGRDSGAIGDHRCDEGESENQRDLRSNPRHVGSFVSYAQLLSRAAAALDKLGTGSVMFFIGDGVRL